jgi:alpha-N-arabinofuranosidase
MHYQNPILPGLTPDPSICRVGSDYYLVTSSFEYFPGVPLFHSRDLIHWEQIGHVLTRESQLPLQGAGSSKGIFAPTLRYHNGRFYLITTNVSDKKNFYVVTDDIRGEWSEPVWVSQGGIDPDLFFDDDGKVYLTTSRNRQSQIDIETGELLTGVKQIWPGTGGGDLEAPHLYKINGLYYLMAAEGGTREGHMVTIARAGTPRGPFEACPRNPILTHRGERPDPDITSTGHGDLFQDHQGNWWMVFLGVRKLPGPFPRVHTLGRETFLAPVTWDEDGWPVVNETGTVTLDMEGPLPPSVPMPDLPVRDTFDVPQLPFHWNFLRNPDINNYAFGDGGLTLRHSPVTLNEADSPTFLGRRQQHHHCHAACRMELQANGNEQVEAGLTAYMNHQHHYEIALRERGREQIVFVRRSIGDLQKVAFETTVPAGPVDFIIETDDTHYHFSYQLPGEDPQPAVSGSARYLSSEVAGGFTGVYFGLYATSNGHAPGGSSAHVAWVEVAVSL